MIGRRDLMRAGGAALAFAAGAPVVANFVFLSPFSPVRSLAVDRSRATWSPDAADIRRLSLANSHTGESLDIAYWEKGDYVQGALGAINHLFRDHRTNEVHVIEPRLLDLLHTLHAILETGEPFQVLSGFRSPSTNALLHDEGAGASKHSLHMKGMAVDIRLAGRTHDELYSAAMGLRSGGVGNYPASNFVHVDVGHVRYWTQNVVSGRPSRA
jgi:uncharacterized protein YcbK (DUF882 family)